MAHAHEESSVMHRLRLVGMVRPVGRLIVTVAAATTMAAACGSIPGLASPTPTRTPVGGLGVPTPAGESAAPSLPTPGSTGTGFPTLTYRYDLSGAVAVTGTVTQEMP